MLKSVFISHHYDKKGKRLAEIVDKVIESHDVHTVTGKRLDGEPLSQKIKDLIDQCQVAVILLTDRDEGKNSQWVKDERAYAVGKGLKILTFIDENLNNDGMFTDREVKVIDWENLHELILYLTQSIRSWKFNLGASYRLLLQPSTVSTKISQSTDDYSIKYRIWRENQSELPQWKTTYARPGQGGAVLYVHGVKRNDSIEVEINIDGTKWHAGTVNLDPVVDLKQKVS